MLIAAHPDKLLLTATSFATYEGGELKERVSTTHLWGAFEFTPRTNFSEATRYCRTMQHDTESGIVSFCKDVANPFAEVNRMRDHVEGFVNWTTDLGVRFDDMSGPYQGDYDKVWAEFIESCPQWVLDFLPPELRSSGRTS